MILVISKLRPLSVSDLNEVNDLIDALTYPLRKQSLTTGGVTLQGELMPRPQRPQPLAKIV
jgi:hypothetical protein